MIDIDKNEKAMIDINIADHNNAINEIEAYITLSKTDSKINKLANDVRKLQICCLIYQLLIINLLYIIIKKLNFVSIIFNIKQN